jgi:hypothetical protein
MEDMELDLFGWLFIRQYIVVAMVVMGFDGAKRILRWIDLYDR